MVLRNTGEQFNPETEHHYEMGEMQIVRSARFLRDQNSPSNYGDIRIIEVPFEDETSLQEVARSADRSVYGIQEITKLQGTINVDGIPIEVASKEVPSSNIIYLDGHVFPIPTAWDMSLLPKHILRSYLQQGIDQIVITRSGQILPFYYGDSLINTAEE